VAIDFTLSPEIENVRDRVRDFIQDSVRPTEEKGDAAGWGRGEWLAALGDLRAEAQERGLWLPHMPAEWGGMGLGHVAMATVSAEAGRSRFGPLALNAQAPDEGNMHTLLHWGTDAQKEKYLRPMCAGYKLIDGRKRSFRSCFAMTEPDAAGSDPTLIQTSAERDGDDWVINGRKWFITGARGAKVAILIARTSRDPEVPQAGTTAFLVDLPADGWENLRDIETLGGSHNHCEIQITDLRVPTESVLGELGQGHLLGQYRLGPARLAHCMRWLGQAETALDLMVDRATKRYSHGSLLADKQGIQWLIAESAIELYQAKLMVLHAAHLIDSKADFRGEVSMTKHFVANSLWRIIDRAIQVHGAMGYSTDTPLANMLKQARWARVADGADEIHMMRAAERTIDIYRKTGSTAGATGNLPL
jgi:acyl-CoA dehydrogenase